MKMIDRKRIGATLLVVSLAFVGSLMLLMALASEESVSAQSQACVPADSPFASLPGAVICGDDEEPTSTPTETPVDCVPSSSPFSSLPGAVICDHLTATAQAILTRTAQANAAATAAAMTATAASVQATAAAVQATQTAVAAEATAMAAQTALAQAQQTAVAQQTAQAIADKTATAVAKKTAQAVARKTATAVAQATLTAGGAPPPMPKPSATPVNVMKVDVTSPVEGATTIEPDMSATLMAGNVTVKIPTLSRDRTYQAMLSESDDCGDMAMACAMISIYDAEGNMESDVRLISSAEIEVMLSADAISELGAGLDGGAVATQADAMGAISVQLMDADGEEWNAIPSSFMLNGDGSATVMAMTRRFSAIALTVDADIVGQARMQLSMALGTPTATPIPTATPVPPPTATPVPPTATPVPPPPPDTGDPSMPFLLLLAMAVGASALALIGAKLITARIRR